MKPEPLRWRRRYHRCHLVTDSSSPVGPLDNECRWYRNRPAKLARYWIPKNNLFIIQTTFFKVALQQPEVEFQIWNEEELWQRINLIKNYRRWLFFPPNFSPGTERAEADGLSWSLMTQNPSFWPGFELKTFSFQSCQEPESQQTYLLWSSL